MTLRELKEWIEKLPEECLEYSIVHAEVSNLPTEDDEDGESSFSIRLDKPITALSVDEENGEIKLPFKHIKFPQEYWLGTPADDEPTEIKNLK